MKRGRPPKLTPEEQAIEKVAQEAVNAEMTTLKTALAVAETRLKAVGAPKFKTPQERSHWVEEKKQALVPHALADVEIALKTGSISQRERARKDVLDMTGHSQGEQLGPQTPLIMIVQGEGRLPWVRKVSDGTVVDAEIVSEERRGLRAKNQK